MHRLLTDKSGQKMLLLGNEAIARGAVEAGVGVSTTYPGTPSSEITLNFFQISRETDLYFEYSTNEKVALEVAAATANSGVRSMCVMKHVGMNVAADPLMTLAYVGVKGGLVIVTADDPAMFSSQNEQDNRYYGKFSGLPVLEPSSVQEAKDMTAYAFELSEMLQEPVILRTTTRLNHATGVVELGKINAPVVQGDFVRDPMNYVTVPAVSKKLHARLLTRLEKAKQISERCVWNFTQGSGAWGIVCNGVSYNYVSDAVSDLGIEAKVKVFRIGLSHPLPEATIKQFLKKCEKVLVVEEGEPLMEETIKAFAQEEKLPLTIAGKGENLFSRLYEYDPALVRKTIATFFDVAYEPAAPVDLSGIPELPQRPPNLCAGCSHRATFHAIKKAAEGMDIICPNDIGCYTLGFLPPLSMGDFLICMGSSIGTACGFSRVTGKKVIAVIGDSTFFHSGMAGLVNAVFNNHNFTLVILDNETTAMTGHQPNPGVDMKNLNMNGYGRVSIENIVRAIGVPHVSVIRPYHVRKSVETIKA
ncbi:MAG: indolepyruvate ferredoxin oxidoreductase subunit alpha, partial [Desulfobacterales bacterium]|nr:indolepyruvate ferredoxin oxidoreductase subunit alpha [Desulfobacterales bacterium]